MENNKDTFSYSYSAREQAELRKIREKYAPTKESDIERLHRLDSGATKSARMWSIIIGVIGTLILGCGMSIVTTDIGITLGIGEWYMAIGIAVGIIGLILICCAYPIYLAVLKHERAKIAPEILRITDELIK